MTAPLAVLVPSRGRPSNIEQLIDAWNATTRFANLHVVIDDDDPCEPEYTKLQMPVGGVLHVIERRRLGGTLNFLAPLLVEDGYTMIGFMGDDHRPRTDNWDAFVRAEQRTKPGAVVYGNDLIHGPGLPTAVFIDSRVISTLGYFVPPGAEHLFLDNFWRTLGEQLGTLTYLPEMVIEHMHPIAGKAEWDEHYVRVNAADVWQRDEAIYHEWIASSMPADIAKVKAALA